MCVVIITQGGGVAAPIGSQIFGEVLPYLDVQKENSEDEIKQEVEVPNIIGLSISDAKKELESIGLNISYEGEENVLEKVVTKQVPIAGIKIYEGTNVKIDY